MNFFDKLISGVSEAGSKAKVLMEQNKLKLINIGKQTQIDKLHKEIGVKLTDLHFAGEQINVQLFQQQLDQIAILKVEIEQNEHEIEMLAEEKTCKQCGKVNNLLAKVCIHCQSVFEIIDVTNTKQVIEPILIDNSKKEL